MRVQEWWHGAVIYEVYLPSFSDANGDGWGDLQGLLRRLDHIASLGVDAIWLTPFYPSPMEDVGYDIAAFCDVDPRFGNLGDFAAVVDRAHALGLRVIIDQVWAHTAAAHPWFQDSASGQASEKADWYVWADARPDGSPPNNWLSVFGGSAWQWHPVRRQYYLHHFLPSQPKLDLRNDEVLNAHFSNAEFWLARGVDGFRLDAIDFMLHDGMLRDNPGNPQRPDPAPWNPFRFQRHLYDMCQPANQELVTDLRRFIDRFPEVVTLGELSSEAGALGRVAALTGRSKLHMAYTLGVMKTAFSPAILREAIADAAIRNQVDGLCWSFSNHDVERAVSRWNSGGGHRAAFALLQLAMLVTLPGSACLYQGEELGLPQARLPASAIRDPFGRTFYPVYAGRDGARTPMPWVAGAANSGFSPATPWLPLDPAHDALAVDQQAKDPSSTLAYCRRLLHWRKSHPALTSGSVELLPTIDPVVAWRRSQDDDRIIAIFNTSDEALTLSPAELPAFAASRELGFISAPSGGELRLPPFGVCLGTEHGNR